MIFSGIMLVFGISTAVPMGIELIANAAAQGKDLRNSDDRLGCPHEWEVAMGRFYFHLQADDQIVPDDEGVDLPDLSAAEARGDTSGA